MQSQELLPVTDAIAPYLRKHARYCVRRASGLVLTGYTENAWLCPDLCPEWGRSTRSLVAAN